MMKSLIFQSLILVICTGCVSSQFVDGAGDAGQFVLRRVAAQGGRPITTNSLPPLPGQWGYLEDDQGTYMRLPREEFPDLELFLRRSFGEPEIPPPWRTGERWEYMGRTQREADFNTGDDGDGIFVRVLHDYQLRDPLFRNGRGDQLAWIPKARVGRLYQRARRRPFRVNRYFAASCGGRQGSPPCSSNCEMLPMTPSGWSPWPILLRGVSICEPQMAKYTNSSNSALLEHDHDNNLGAANFGTASRCKVLLRAGVVRIRG